MDASAADFLPQTVFGEARSRAKPMLVGGLPDRPLEGAGEPG